MLGDFSTKTPTKFFEEHHVFVTALRTKFLSKKNDGYLCL